MNPVGQIQQFFQYLLNAIKIWIIIQPWEVGLRIRIGKRIKKLGKGIHFKIPYLDSIYIQEKRLRVISLPIQTLTTSDLQTVTLNGAVGYTIVDIEKLYQTLFQPETTISNMIMSAMSEFIFANKLEDIDHELIVKFVLKKLELDDYGIEFKYFKITNFAVVRTYRLIVDQSWMHNEMVSMNKKR